MIVVGAGPAGLVTALELARHNVEVTVLEAEPDIPRNLRGSTFHPSTLDMLERAFGAATALRTLGLEAAKVQYRRHGRGPIAEFDFGDIADLTDHPFRVQAEQFKLCDTLYAQLKALEHADVRFSARVTDAGQSAAAAFVHLASGERLEADYVVGGDGANSQVRKSSGIGFEGFTWPERFLVVSTPTDFSTLICDLADVTYVADPEQWYFLLRVPELWRVMFPIGSNEADDDALAHSAVQDRMRRVYDLKRDYEIAHLTLYKVHQRVADRYCDGRLLLVGDAAHVNNPLGGMGMNGGIHDAFNLAGKLLEVFGGADANAALSRYEHERRGVALEYVQRISIQNKHDLEAATPQAQAAFETRLRSAAADPAQRRELLRRLSMLASLAPASR